MYIKIGSININKFYRILMKMCRKGARTIECVMCFHKWNDTIIYQRYIMLNEATHKRD